MEAGGRDTAAAATAGTGRPLEVQQSEVSPTVARDVVEERVRRSVQDMMADRGMDGQEMEGQMTAESERLPDYEEVMQSRRSTVGQGEEGEWVPVYRESDDGGGRWSCGS